MKRLFIFLSMIPTITLCNDDLPNLKVAKEISIKLKGSFDELLN
jgi:hypothetical protein